MMLLSLFIVWALLNTKREKKHKMYLPHEVSLGLGELVYFLWHLLDVDIYHLTAATEAKYIFYILLW